LPQDKQEAVKAEFEKVKNDSTQGALANMTIFPLVMLIAYILLILYFKSQGGYKPIELGKDH